ncbi:hypothetical protein LQ948_05700 [Jiella sp. MQZ9-1]|uniref:Uncharacterized protein n=1 Tax=Jiella flava TaxID=2816857 RepID=A0A939FU34_9HYPH|nr:hypothetical protein [Jiella flava]MBO0661973.1 hypothetical protein [Jiella flava]MCD2470700.1 hypothetical protein [Jiella flava]
MAANRDGIPNETTCPVSLDLLAKLLRSDGPLKDDLIRAIAPMERARLAFFCYNRVHLRALAFHITLLCDLRELRILAGAKGDLLYQQATEYGIFEDQDRVAVKHRGITLARSAHG